jgi:hypothetical protein
MKNSSLLSSLFGVVCVPGNFIGVLIAKNGFAPICELTLLKTVHLEQSCSEQHLEFLYFAQMDILFIGGYHNLL